MASTIEQLSTSRSWVPWWELVHRGEALTVTLEATGAGEFGFLAGPGGTPAKWTTDRRFGPGRTVLALPATTGGLWRLGLYHSRGAGSVTVTIAAAAKTTSSSTTATKDGAVPLYRLTTQLGDLPAGTIVRRRGDTVPVVDPALLPFAVTSPWRLAVADTAEFAAASDPRNVAIRNTGADGSGKVWVASGDYSHPVTQASDTDPLATISDTSHSTTGLPAGGSWQARIPATARIASGSDGHMHVITPDGSTVLEHFAVTRNSPTSYRCYRRHAVDLTGSGVGPQNGVRAYGGSAIGGLIRSWEVDPTHPRYTGRIEHPLAVSLRNDQLFKDGTYRAQDGNGNAYSRDGYGLAGGYVWPATEQDYDGFWAYTGAIPMGSYFAIPPTVDITTLDLRTPQGRVLARAAQDYGVYATDRGGSANFYCEDDGGGPAETFASALRGGNSYSAHDARVVFNALRVVTNNTPATPNGGTLTASRRA